MVFQERERQRREVVIFWNQAQSFGTSFLEQVTFFGPQFLHLYKANLIMHINCIFMSFN